MCCNTIPRRLLLLIACIGLVLGLGRLVTDHAVADDTKQESKPMDVPAALDFKVKSIAGEDVHLSEYHGDVVLIVNVASKCGLTPQYKQLQKLHEDYADKGLSILGFPANNFAGQEPGSNEDIETFCEENYGVEFDMFAKISVKGEDQAPLYKFLTSKKTNPAFAGEIRWNFDKFLVNREGKVIARFEPRTKPDADEVVRAIRAELDKPAPKKAEASE